MKSETVTLIYEWEKTQNSQRYYLSFKHNEANSPDNGNKRNYSHRRPSKKDSCSKETKKKFHLIAVSGYFHTLRQTKICFFFSYI